MKIYYLSDTHNDYQGNNFLLTLEGDKNAVLVVAGDTNSKGRTVRDIEAVADRWKHIIAVPGNHDWWGLAIHEPHKFSSDKDNVSVLLDDWIIINNICFFGGTCWHPINEWDEYVWKFTMNDSKQIRGTNWRRLRGSDISKIHNSSLAFIENVKRTFPDLKKVLVTHHALCSLSLDEQCAGQSSNSWYYSENPDLLEGIDFHIHGHIHCESDYEVYGCRVLCNPKGYSQQENPDFEIKYIEV